LDNRFLSKFITIGDDRFYVLGKVLVENCRYTPEDLKIMWGLADTILKNNEYYYACMKLIEAEIEELTDKKTKTEN
jgi:hypothetical protein